MGDSGGQHRALVEWCEQLLAQYGDNYLGVGWTKSQEHADRRYRVMLDLLGGDPAERTSLMDFGCGAGHLLDYLLRTGTPQPVEYVGVDASPKFLSLCRAKFPDITFLQSDGFNGDLPVTDYAVMNGLLTMKGDLPFEQMWDHATRLLQRVFRHTTSGLAFNVMSKQVEWERDDLFHVPMDRLSSFISTALSRHFVIRHDYGLYEYTVYVYHRPQSVTQG
jgi:SAM-dependent methyltransferase